MTTCACTAVEPGGGPPPFTSSIGSSIDDGDDGSSDEDDSGGGDGPAGSLDLGGSGVHPGAVGCKGIDFLFVVDNSKSMAMQQDRLVASFDGFIAAIEASLTDVTSYHVGVVTSDGYDYNESGCRGLGDLVTYTGGTDSSNRSCGPFAAGQRFATEEDELATVFPCIADVGTGGDNAEYPVSAAVAALSPEKLAPGGCNAGFVRDDAILVVVVVTDDPPFAGDPDDANLSTDTSGWHSAVVAAKQGNEAAAVVIGFVPWDDLSCLVYSVDSPNLIEFVESFDYGVLASVCDTDYASTFASTIATIETSCDEFTPVG